MKSYELFVIWLHLLISMVLNIFAPYVWIRKKRLIRWEDAKGWTKFNQANLKKHDKRNNLVVKIIISVGAVLYTILTIPLYQDVPYLLSGKYQEIQGYVVEDQVDSSNRAPSLTAVFVKNEDTGKVERLRIGKSYLKKGAYVRIRYLPHSKQGCAIPVENSEVEQE